MPISRLDGISEATARGGCLGGETLREGGASGAIPRPF